MLEDSFDRKAATINVFIEKKDPSNDKWRLLAHLNRLG